jgi:hypothetical protein
VTTDSLSNATVGSLHGTASRAKHLLRHYHAFMQRVKLGEVELKHISGLKNPSNMLTKWVPAAEFQMATEYLSGVTAAATLPDARPKPAIANCEISILEKAVQEEQYPSETLGPSGTTEPGGFEPKEDDFPPLRKTVTLADTGWHPERVRPRRKQSNLSKVFEQVFTQATQGQPWSEA